MPKRSRTDPEDVSRLRSDSSILLTGGDRDRNKGCRASCGERPRALESSDCHAGQEPISIQDVGQQIVGTDAGQSPHRLDDVRRRVRAILTPPASRQSQLRMDAAFPVNDENDFTGGRIGIDDDFVNEGANEAFLQPDIRVRTMPHRVQIRRQILEVCSGVGTTT